jgi:LPXTG-motif cell wall-anchored protein
VLTGNITNKKGNLLPTTGGMGTRIFTIAGSILILGAVILFVTKKRMDMNK